MHGLRAAVLAVLVLLVSMPVEARKGGSIGGRGGFSSGRSSGSSFGSRSSGSGSSFRGGYRSPSSRSSGGGFFFFGSPFGGSRPAATATAADGTTTAAAEDDDDTVGIVIAFLVLAGVVVLVVWQVRKQKKAIDAAWGRTGAGQRGLHEGGNAVARLSIGFLATEKDLQHGLDALARETNRPAGAEGDAWVLREVTVLMAQSRDAITKFHFEQEAGLSWDSARTRLEEVGMDLRARFEGEAIRADEHGVRATAADKAGDMEVAEHVVVSIAVAFRVPTLQKTNITDSTKLLELVREMATIGGDRLLGIEVAWDPSSPEDALTSRELDEHYPELLPV